MLEEYEPGFQGRFKRRVEALQLKNGDEDSDCEELEFVETLPEPAPVDIMNRAIARRDNIDIET